MHERVGSRVYKRVCSRLCTRGVGRRAKRNVLCLQEDATVHGFDIHHPQAHL